MKTNPRYLRTAVTMRLSDSRKSCRLAGGRLARSCESVAAAPGCASRKRLGSLRGKLDGISARVLLGPAALDQPAPEQARDDVGECRSVDPGSLDEVGLRQAFLVGDDHQHGELAGRQPARTGLRGEDVGSALARAVQQVHRRAIQVVSCLNHATRHVRVGRVPLLAYALLTGRFTTLLQPKNASSKRGVATGPVVVIRF